ncbi:MAG: class I SAM-dependent methyltransferase [Chloracidobacterium sp.]|nr:class I SAM-dependent methyltransferase [Chloracidobacterium sp.]MDW8217234.1 class I SAM-dependent methyltransferase [Acidobacteriota bacterium]
MDNQPDYQAEWDARYRSGYGLGEAPNAFLASQAYRLQPGWKALAVADGEGRNGVWLAEQGLDVFSVDVSPVAQDRARQLAARRGVAVAFACADLLTLALPEAEFDVVVAIFIQFAGPPARDELFVKLKRALRPGGLFLLEGYRTEQLNYRTGGPPCVENLYTEEFIRTTFADFEVLHLASRDAVLEEGTAHRGMSALLDLVARKPSSLMDTR